MIYLFQREISSKHKFLSSKFNKRVFGRYNYSVIKFKNKVNDYIPLNHRTDNLTDELQDQLIAKGYDIEKTDFSAEVADYAKSTRYKRYGVTFDIYKTKDRKNKAVTFSIIMKERYFFGVRYKGEAVTGPALVAALTGVDPLIDVDVDHSAWAACATASPRNELNFKTMTSEGFGKLKNPTARAAFMGGIANEIDTLIKKMVKSFKDKGL